MNKFRSLKEATELYRMTRNIKLPPFMKDQLLRASSSVALNLSEGNARRTAKDRRRFFNIAYASVREVQTICKLEDLESIAKKADLVGGMIYCLCRKLTETVTETEAETVTVKEPNASKTS